MQISPCFPRTDALRDPSRLAFEWTRIKVHVRPLHAPSPCLPRAPECLLTWSLTGGENREHGELRIEVLDYQQNQYDSNDSWTELTKRMSATMAQFKDKKNPARAIKIWNIKEDRERERDSEHHELIGRAIQWPPRSIHWYYRQIIDAIFIRSKLPYPLAILLLNVYQMNVYF